MLESLVDATIYNITQVWVGIGKFNEFDPFLGFYGDPEKTEQKMSVEHAMYLMDTGVHVLGNQQDKEHYEKMKAREAELKKKSRQKNQNV